MSSTSIPPSTTAEQEPPPTTERHALVKDLKKIVEVLLAVPLPNTDTCLQQLRVVSSRVQSSTDLATASAATSSSYTVEELEARYLLTCERLELLVKDVKNAEVCHADAKKALHTRRKAEDAAKANDAVAAKADGQNARFSSSFSTRSLTTRIFTRGIAPQPPSTEPLQQVATDDWQSAVVAISTNVSGRRKPAVRSAKEGVHALTHVTEGDEESAPTCITRPLEFDPEMSRVTYAAGVSMLGVLVYRSFFRRRRRRHLACQIDVSLHVWYHFIVWSRLVCVVVCRFFQGPHTANFGVGVVSSLKKRDTIAFFFVFFFCFVCLRDTTTIYSICLR